MLSFMRNKQVGIWRKGPGIMAAHGLLDDDIYSLEITVSVSVSGMQVQSLEGRWNRWTTPECHRAIGPLQEVVGLSLEEKGFSERVHKIMGRRACRHFANLFLECCHCLRQAARMSNAGQDLKERSGASFNDFPGDGSGEIPDPPLARPGPVGKRPADKDATTGQRVLEGGSQAMVIDLHTHSSPASPCSSAPVDELIMEAKRIGLDAICLTEHNHLWDAAEVEELRNKHHFLVLRGNEITTDQGDMIVFGFYEDIRGIVTLEELRQKVVEAGGFIIAAHPFRGFLTFGAGQLGLTPERAMKRRLFTAVDAVESLNSKVTPQENDLASKVAAGLGLPATGGSDAHEVEEVGIYATRFSRPIHNEKDLVAALKRGECAPVIHRSTHRATS